MSPRIAFLLVRHPAGRVSPVMPQVVQLLAARGATVDVIHADDYAERPPQLDGGHDLYVLKAKTPAALRIAESLHARGAATLNPFPVTALCRDKVATTRILANAGVRVPETKAEPSEEDLTLLLSGGPVVVKPRRGSQGEGVRVIRDVSDLEAVDTTEALMAQRFVEADGPDHKIYRIGERCFCVLRRWPVRDYADKLGQPGEVGQELWELTRRCGYALGIDLFGIDVVVSAGRPYVVDLSSFPGFKGVPDAARLLSEYIFAAAWRHRQAS